MTQICIVEDSLTQAERLKNFLNENHFHVTVARNGKAALDVVSATKPSLIISDVIMPEMDGYMLCSELRKNFTTYQLPIILLTTLAEPDDIVKALACGVNYFITKPYQEGHLLKAIQDALQIQKIRTKGDVANQDKIYFHGHEHLITAQKSQILDLLVSTYDASVQKNQQLYEASQEILELNNVLEQKVEERTEKLQKSEEHFRNLSEKLKVALDEREIMLKEIHHRVKNNLQVISSLLNLQAESEQEAAIKQCLMKGVTRVHSMALVHQMLYESDNLSHISIKNYIDNFLGYLDDIYGHLDRIKVQSDIEDIEFRIDMAIPCGLIINELLSNCYKHAFPNQREGFIRISLKKTDDNIQLVLQDNGVGIPSHIDISNTNSLGMRLIHNLSKQLNAKLEFEQNELTSFRLGFRVE